MKLQSISTVYISWLQSDQEFINPGQTKFILNPDGRIYTNSEGLVFTPEELMSQTTLDIGVIALNNTESLTSAQKRTLNEVISRVYIVNPYAKIFSRGSYLQEYVIATLNNIKAR